MDIKKELEGMGLTVVVPSSALKMQESGDFDVEKHKSWFANPDDYDEKARLMREHFDRIAEGDSILVLNYEKKGRQNYIGANVLMEMSLAFYLKKPIFILNDMPDDSPFEEELKGMMPVILHGKLATLAKTVG